MTGAEIVLKYLKRHALKSDQKWQSALEKGYRWYPNQFSQDIELIRSGQEFIRIKTEVLEDVELNHQNLHIIADLLFTSTMSGLIYEDGKLSLCSQLYIDEDNLNWGTKILGQASLLQIAEATFTIAKVADAMGTKAPYKEHPSSGPRLLIDSRIEKTIFNIVEMGKKPSMWSTQDLSQLKLSCIKPPAKLISDEQDSVDIEFPFGPYKSICKITNHAQHPRVGSGLTMVQSFPIEGIPHDEGIKLSLNFNYKDLNVNRQGYEIGSYCYRNGLFSYISFIPNCAHSPNLLPNLYTSCKDRAKKISREFTGDTWLSNS
jgi:hypothetical protein